MKSSLMKNTLATNEFICEDSQQFTDPKKIALFSPKIEALNLYFPLFFIVVMIWELVTLHEFTNPEKNYGTFISKILFFNHIHTYFSLALVLLSPEIRGWFSRKNGTDRLFLLKFIGLFLFFFVLFRWIEPFLRQQGGYSWALAAILAWVIFAEFHHSLYQSLGLSLSYIRKFELDPDKNFSNLAKLRRLERAERLLCRSILILKIAMILLLGFQISNLKFFYLCLGGIALCVSGLFAIGLSYPNAMINKKIFMVRYIFYPLMPFSYIASFAWSSLHGVEYFCTFRQMQEQSIRRSNLKRTSILVYSSLIVLLFSLLAIVGRSEAHYWIEPVFVDFPSLTAYLGSMAIAGSYAHYYLDSLMFRMSDPTTRNSVGPLLLYEPTAADRS
jgi:hypothetical protein